MSEQTPDVETENRLPEAHVRRMRFPFPLIWLVPTAAAAFAAFVLHQQYRAFGTKVLIAFEDANELKPGESPVRYRGVTVGLVTDVRLDEPMKHAIAEVTLKRDAESLARKGTSFWIVRPELAQNAISGLGTIFSGPYIDLEPGKGESQNEFTGLAHEPSSGPERGLKLVLRTSNLGQVSINSRVYYRGVPVGSVEDISISRDSRRAEVTVAIERPFSRLLSPDTKFWTIGGADVHGSLFTGLQMKVESLRSLVAGGVAFATPSETGAGNVREDAVFDLEDKPDEDWLEWSPKITLPDLALKESRTEEQAKTHTAINEALDRKEK